MPLGKRIKQLLIGSPLNPFNPQIMRHVSLVAFFAWIGLGADGLIFLNVWSRRSLHSTWSSYHFALYIAIATFVTVFVISLGYNQVIELFPSGGGGYKVASRLLGPYIGLDFRRSLNCRLYIDYCRFNCQCHGCRI